MALQSVLRRQRPLQIQYFPRPAPEQYNVLSAQAELTMMITL